MTSALWKQRFMNLAKEYASWSKDPSKKVGSIAVKDKQIISYGYNGFPRGIEDLESRLNDRETKYIYTAHSEKNLIYNACLNGQSLKDSMVFVYGLPVCYECAKGLIQVGVTEVFYTVDGFLADKWKESNEITMDMFREVGIKYTEIR